MFRGDVMLLVFSRRPKTYTMRHMVFKVDERLWLRHCRCGRKLRIWEDGKDKLWHRQHRYINYYQCLLEVTTKVVDKASWFCSTLPKKCRCINCAVTHASLIYVYHAIGGLFYIKTRKLCTLTPFSPSTPMVSEDKVFARRT